MSIVALSGCARGGRGWVEEVPYAHRSRAPESPPRTALLASEADDVVIPPRPVITLGERDEWAEGSAPQPPPSPTIVQVNVAAPAWAAPYGGYGYGGYGYGGWGSWSERPGHHPGRPDRCESRPKSEPAGPPAPPPVAGDYAPPPSYGPAPLTHTLPGNPWR